MSAARPAGGRRQAILEALARELERGPGERITTARLARAVGVSEAALYRHFASKAQMFDALMDFAEEGVFARINQILDGHRSASLRCERIVWLVLGFGERNPGIARLLVGEALAGERERLRARASRLFERLEVQLRQVLREGHMRGELLDPAPAAAGVLAAYVAGRLQRFVQSGFTERPLARWEAEGPRLLAVLPLAGPGAP
ncbi:nucleoid occlusion factor SlmA [Inmirania thermothiophila]|uniref:TetR family transcriptional regulator n=1 Tax=Inmirania thermothiophila TaxID=1750597 RepID=A0A3N1Y6V0_9GAMM|nr:nucleoid occlusion factor SlmA [Inmirania thermothiophila]ROR34480.1 TetR family transcriptional regulator [Inmirania thermothiophila]